MDTLWDHPQEPGKATGAAAPSRPEALMAAPTSGLRLSL